MASNNTVKHKIGQDILTHLATHQYGRFSDMRPPKVDTNLFTYHLKLLLKAGYITKDATNYTLSSKGQVYIDRHIPVGETVRTQPKIITMLLIQDGYGKMLVQQRTKQPYINTWTLPYGTMLIEDESVLACGARIAADKLNFVPANLRHTGDCYITVGHMATIAARPIEAGTLIDGDILHLNTEEVFQTESRTLVHLVRFETDDLAASDTTKWIEPLDITKMGAAPAVEQIIARAFFGDDFFFEEFRVEA